MNIKSAVIRKKGEILCICGVYKRNNWQKETKK